MKRVFVIVLVAVLVLVGAVALYFWRASSVAIVVDAPPPEVTNEAADSVPAPPPSIVEAPITFDISTAVDSLEAAIPRAYGDVNQRLQAGNNSRMQFGFAVSRTPFRVSVAGLTISISTDIEYEGRGWYHPVIGPEVSAACGTGGVPRPRLRATLVSTARLSNNWRLGTKTTVTQLEPYSDSTRDRCRVTPFRIDVTNRVVEATRNLLEQNLAKFDNAVSRWNARGRFENLWHQLARPIRLTDSVYMVINPFAAELGSVGTEGGNIVAHVRLIASPRVITGPRPNDSTRISPLPLLGRAAVQGSGAHVMLDGSFSYPVASALLRRVLVGRSVKQSGRRVYLRDVVLSGIGGGRVAMAITLDGAVKGKLYLTGTPRLDRDRHQVEVPDLDYDVGSARLLIRSIEWLKGMDVREFLRTRARLPDSAFIGKLSELAEKGMNRTLSPGIVLSARIDRAEGTNVFATKQEIRVRALAEAQIELAINRSPRVPRPRLPTPAARSSVPP